MNIYELLLLMVFAHLLADWTLQTQIQAQNKAKNWYIMSVHVFIWTTAIFIPLLIAGYHINPFAWIIMFAIHVIVDQWKCMAVWKRRGDNGKELEWNDKNFKPWMLYVDQGIHIVQIVGLFLFYGIFA